MSGSHFCALFKSRISMFHMSSANAISECWWQRFSFVWTAFVQVQTLRAWNLMRLAALAKLKADGMASKNHSANPSSCSVTHKTCLHLPPLSLQYCRKWEKKGTWGHLHLVKQKCCSTGGARANIFPAQEQTVAADLFHVILLKGPGNVSSKYSCTDDSNVIAPTNCHM